MPRARDAGSWVLDPIEVFDGEKDLYVYKRPTSQKYQLYLKTLSEGVIRESTKKEKLDEACSMQEIDIVEKNLLKTYH